MLKTIAAGIAVLMAGSEAKQIETDDYQFTLYMAQFNKNYQSLEEYSLRLIEFSKINQGITEFSQRPHTSWVAHNKFSDWTQAERDFMLGYHIGMREFRHQAYYQNTKVEHVNWVQKGAVTPVQNQHVCGSDWAFASTGLVEANHFFETGKLVDLSEQHLIDCTQIYGNKGCLGGAMDGALRYAQDHGVMTELDYPYKGLTREGCKANWARDVVGINEFVDVPPMNPEQLAKAIQHGPVAVALQADNLVFMQYSGGVITEESCGHDVNHAALVVGYGTENNLEYFLVKNSWGPKWGDLGYVKVGVRSGEGVCGIQVAPVQFKKGPGLNQPGPTHPSALQ